VRPLPPHIEIHENLGRTPNVHFFRTTPELLELLKSPPVWREMPENRALIGDARRAASDLRDVIEQCVRDASYQVISERFRAMHTIYGAAHLLNRPSPLEPADAAAKLVGDKVTHLFARLFRLKPFYHSMRLIYRAARGVLGRRPVQPEND
jgi:hypothetical protein